MERLDTTLDTALVDTLTMDTQASDAALVDMVQVMHLLLMIVRPESLMPVVDIIMDSSSALCMLCMAVIMAPPRVPAMVLPLMLK